MKKTNTYFSSLTKVSLLSLSLVSIISCNKKSDSTIEGDVKTSVNVSDDVVINEDGVKVGDDLKINKEGVNVGDDIKVEDDAVKIGDIEISKDGIKTGGSINVQSDKKEWPKEINAFVPEFKNAEVVSSDIVTVGSINTISVELKDVSEEQYKAYVQSIDTSKYKITDEDEDEDEISNTYSSGLNNLSLEYSKEDKTLEINLVGNKK